MIWLTWRQLRTQTLVIAGAVIVVAAILAVTGPDLVHRLATERTDFLPRLAVERLPKTLYLLGVAALYAVPSIIGAFWGAPLVARELEAGTHRLVWNQSVTRTRWLATKLGVAALVSVLVSGGLALAVSWWAGPIDRAIDQGNPDGIFSLPRIYPLVFGARGIVPIGYTLFAFALGVALGLILRRSVLAVALTLILVIAVQIAMPALVRTHLIATQTSKIVITADTMDGMRGRPPEPGGAPVIEEIVVEQGASGNWLLSNHTVDATGTRPATLPSWVVECGAVKMPRTGEPPTQESIEDSQNECFTRLATLGYRQQIVSHPASQFWSLQWRETGLLLFATALLTGFCFWRIRRDFS
jgi:hypothetical protein